MSVDRKEIDLIMRAQVQGKQSLDGVTKSITELETAIKAQAEAAKKGEASLDDLKATLLALQQVQDKLRDQAGLIGQYDKLTSQIAKAGEKVALAAKAFSDYQAKLAGLATPTQAQADRLLKLGAASDRATLTLGKQKDQLANLQGILQESGINLDNMADAETRVRTAAAQLGISINTANQSIADFAKNSAKASAEAKQLAIEQREATESANLLTQAEKRASDEVAAHAAFLAESAAAQKRITDSDYISWWEKVAAVEAKVTSGARIGKKEQDAFAAAVGHQNIKSAIPILQQMAKAESDYAAQTDKAVAARKRSESANSLFNDSGRTTLSLLQRIRGEILSVAAAYVGLYGVINGASKVLDAYNTKQAVLNQLTIQAGGDKNKAGQEFAYIAGQAERLGINLTEAAKGYAKFSAAATFAGRTNQENRFVFESISEVARVAGLTSDQLGRVFYAISQIDSKGRVMAEEFNQQLGDALPGLTGIAKKATEGIFADFNAAMKDGKVSLDVFIEILAKYREAVSGQLPDAIKLLQADQERFNNTLFDFKNLIAESGFADAYRSLINDLTKFFKSEDGRTFARNLGEAFQSVVAVLRILANNIDLIVLALKIGIGLYGARAIAGLVVSLWTAVEALIAFRAGLAAATVQIGLMQRAFFLLQAFFVGWSIGSWLNDNVPLVSKGAFAIIGIIDYLTTAIAGFMRILWDELGVIARNGARALGVALTSGLASFFVTFEKLGDKSATTRAKLKADLEAIQKTIADGLAEENKPKAAPKAGAAATGKPDGAGFQRDRLDSQKRIEDQLTKLETSIKRKEAGALGAVKAAYESLVTEINALGGKEGDALLKRLEKLHNKQLAAENTTGQKRVDNKKQVEAELEALEADTARNEDNRLSKRLNNLDDKYSKLAAKIAKIGGADGRALLDRLEADKAASVNKEILDAQQSLHDSIEKLDTEAGKRDKDNLDARLQAAHDSVINSTKKMFDDLAELRKAQSAAGKDTSGTDDLEKRARADVTQLQQLAQKQVYTDELARLEKQVNDLIEQRTARIDAQNTLKKAGLQTDLQTKENSAAIVEELQPQIEALTEEALRFAEAMGSAIDPTKLAVFIAKMEEAKGSAKGLKTELFSAAQVNEMLANGASTAFDNASKAIGGAIAKTNSWADALGAVRDAFLNFAADFLRQIAQMILKQALLNILQSQGGEGGGGLGGAIAGALNGLFLHAGGVVGGSNPTRPAHASWFANAPRYHTGGIAGLAPDEFPAILQKNEEVLRASDPRNVLNGGGAGGAAPRSQDIKILNMIDSGSVVTEGLSTQEGTKAIFNFIRANRTNLKTLLN